MKKFIHIFFAAISVFFYFASCTDIDSQNVTVSEVVPVLTIDTFSCNGEPRAIILSGISCGKEISFNGTIINPAKIKGVYSQVKYPEDIYFADFKKAEVSNGKWSCKLHFEDEGTVFVRFVIIDENNKPIENSAKVIPLNITEEPEEDAIWFIYNMDTEEKVFISQKAELEELNLDSPQYRKYAQNDSFSIIANFNNKTSSKCNFIQIYDEEDNEICKIRKTSSYKDILKFDVSKKSLIESDSKLGKGKHYLHFAYTLDDLEIDAGYFVWWPESDFPEVIFENAEMENDEINLPVNKDFSITFFDDDFLDSVLCALLTEEEVVQYAEELSELEDSPFKFLNAVNKNGLANNFISYNPQNKKSEIFINLKSAPIAQDMMLVAIARDTSSAKNVTIKTFDVHVIDDSVSVLNIDYPKSNEIPVTSIDENNEKAVVSIKGCAVDSVGCSSLQFIWVAGELTQEEKLEKAKKFVETVTKETSYVPVEDNSIKIWNVNLSAPDKHDDFFYQDFTLDVDLLNDFGDEKQNDKFFVVRLVRKDGRTNYLDYKLRCDNELPAIKSVEFNVTDGITAFVTMTKAVVINGSPSFSILITKNNKSSKVALPLKESSSTKLVFSKKDMLETESDFEGIISYEPSSCINNVTAVTDVFGNMLSLQTENSEKDTSVLIDTKKPVIISMAPEGETAPQSNIFKNGNHITLKFDESVKKASGSIILRQTENWPLPPVISESNFKKICSLLNPKEIEILSRQEDGKNMKDSEQILGSSSKFPNDTYHGTGQYVGPYKKSVQGLVLSNNKGIFTPDLSEKYVLDFDIDIWETDKEHYFGKTFEKGFATLQKYQNRTFESLLNLIKINNPDESKSNKAKRTASQIREVLEKVHYHERIVDINSSDVVISEDGTLVTITFPAGLCDESDNLPNGRQWELVIKGPAFSDMNGNFLLSKSESNLIVENINGTKYFYSDKVAKPVVRIDRYSYGLGIWQSDKNGNKASLIMADKANYPPQSHDSIKPTGYVRTRIDCETKGARIRYTIAEKSEKARTDIPPSDEEPLYIDNNTFYSYYTDTKDFSDTDLVRITSYKNSSEPVNNETVSPIFAVGNGKYNQSFKNYVVAIAEKPGFESSAQGIEGVYQTVVQFVNPKTGSGSSATSSTIGQKDLSIHGTSLQFLESYVLPSPIRKYQNGSPYLRRCYRENTSKENSTSLDYYWVSYEILTDSSFSYYNWDLNCYEWSESEGIMRPGEFTRFISK